MSNSTITARADNSRIDDVKTTVAGMADEATISVIERLQDRLVAALDLQLTFKPIHWNVVGMNFIAIHEMLDPQVDAVRLQSDELAERSTLASSPIIGRRWRNSVISTPVSEDMVIGHLRDLELFQWLVRSHLMDATGDVVHRSNFDKS
jgi:starvation-inducible DNA-binding protein